MERLGGGKDRERENENEQQVLSQADSWKIPPPSNCRMPENFSGLSIHAEDGQTERLKSVSDGREVCHLYGSSQLPHDVPLGTF